MDRTKYIEQIYNTLTQAISDSKKIDEGTIADYIPELANADPECTTASIKLVSGDLIIPQKLEQENQYKFTLQSVSKLVIFIGLMEEYGSKKVYSWIGTEPSGQHFSSISRLEAFGPVPSNPLVNAGAIALSSHIPGKNNLEKLAWLDKWIKILFDTELPINTSVYNSELATGDKNRSIAYLMKSTGVLNSEVETVLKPYFHLCSYELNISQATHLPMLLASGGLSPDGKRIISESTTKQVIAIMATCGLYDESGTYLVQIGMPAKSGVSGLMVAVAVGRGGIAVFNPRLNAKGSSVRGYFILRELSKHLDWHIAAPSQY